MKWEEGVGARIKMKTLIVLFPLSSPLQLMPFLLSLERGKRRKRRRRICPKS